MIRDRHQPGPIAHCARCGGWIAEVDGGTLYRPMREWRCINCGRPEVAQIPLATQEAIAARERYLQGARKGVEARKAKAQKISDEWRV